MEKGMSYAMMHAYAEVMESIAVQLIKAQEPLEEHHMPCSICGCETDPLNNLFLITDLVSGEQAYRHYRAQHFLPVCYREIQCCPGTPEMAKFLEGGSRLRTLYPLGEECPMAWKMTLEEGMGEALRLFGSRQKQPCFSFVLRKGVWVQEYRCRPMEDVFKLRVVSL